MSSIQLPPEHIFQESDSYTCGPCCLAMVYSLKGKHILLSDILSDFNHPEKGKPTYIPQLAEHLEKNGIKTKLLVSTSKLLSPAWSRLPVAELIENLEKWLKVHKSNPFIKDVEYMISYLKKGGTVEQDSYTTRTLKEMLDRGSVVILGVDEDWIWGHRLKLEGHKRVVDDIAGGVEGHFVLIKSYKGQNFHVLDPFPTNLENKHGEYDVNENQLLNASLTWDSQVLEILS